MSADEFFSDAMIRELNEALGLPPDPDKDMASHCETCATDLKAIRELKEHQKLGHWAYAQGFYSMICYWNGLKDGELRDSYWWAMFLGRDEAYISKAKARISELAKESHIEAPFDQEAGT